MASDADDLSPEEEKLLAMYIAKYNAEVEGREDTLLYKSLVNNDSARNWARAHSWRAWQAYYIDNRERMDALIASRLKHSNARIPPKGQSTTRPVSKKAGATPRRVRVEFSDADDDHLVAYLAIENPLPKDRQGKALYERLVADSTGFWPWAVRHTSQSWRERYVKHIDTFDVQIQKFMKKHGFEPSDVKNEKQRRKLWEMLEGKDGQPESPAKSPKAGPSKQTSRPAKSVPQRREDITDDGRKSSASHTTNGKRRAANDSDDERVRKKTRTAPATHVGRTKENTSRSGDDTAQSTNRDLSVPPIAVVETSDPEPADQPQNIKRKSAKPTLHQVAQTAEDIVESLPAQHATGDNRSPKPVHPTHAARDSPVNAGGRHQDKINSKSSHDVQMTPRDRDEPTTSTPRNNSIAPVSQAIPTPRTLDILVSNDSRDPQTVQEPTPPTSDAPFSPNLDHVRERNTPPAPTNNSTARYSPVISPASAHSAASRASTPSPPQRSTRKKKALKKVAKDDNFFGSPSPARSTSTPGRRARQLPIRAEGALNSAFTDAEGRPNAIRNGARRKNGMSPDLDEATSAESWPPKRHKASQIGDHGAALFLPETSPQPTLLHPKTEYEENRPPSSSPPRSPPPDREHHPFSQPSQVAAVLVREHHPFSQPSQPLYEEDEPDELTNADNQRDTSPSHPFSDESREASPITERASSSNRSRAKDHRELIRQPVPTRFKSSALSTAPTLPAGLDTSTPLTDHAHKIDKGKQRAVEDHDSGLSSNRRHTVGGIPSLTELDSHMHRPWSSPHAPSAAPSSSSSIIHLSYGDVSLDPRDHVEVFKTMLKRAVKKTGFPKDVVYQVWHATGSWTAACEILSGERVQGPARQAIVEAIEEHSRADISRSSDLGFGNLMLLRDDRAQTPPAVGAPDVPPESPAYVPPDNSRAAIYLKMHGMPKPTIAQNSPERHFSEDGEDGSDGEEDDLAVPILSQMKDHEEKHTAQAQHEDYAAMNEVEGRIQLAKQILANARRR